MILLCAFVAEDGTLFLSREISYGGQRDRSALSKVFPRSFAQCLFILKAQLVDFSRVSKTNLKVRSNVFKSSGPTSKICIPIAFPFRSTVHIEIFTIDRSENGPIPFAFSHAQIWEMSAAHRSRSIMDVNDFETPTLPHCSRQIRPECALRENRKERRHSLRFRTAETVRDKCKLSNRTDKRKISERLDVSRKNSNVRARNVGRRRAGAPTQQHLQQQNYKNNTSTHRLGGFRGRQRSAIPLSTTTRTPVRDEGSTPTGILACVSTTRLRFDVAFLATIAPIDAPL